MGDLFSYSIFSSVISHNMILSFFERWNDVMAKYLKCLENHPASCRIMSHG